MDFSNYFKLEDLKILVESNKEDVSLSHKDREIFDTLFEKHYYTPLMSYLSDMRDKNILTKIENSEGHNTFFSQGWNLFLDNKKDRYGRTIASTFDKLYFFETTPIFNSNDRIKALDKSYKSLVKKINDGNFDNFTMPEDGCICYECSQKLKLSFENWIPKFSVFEKVNGKTNYRKFVKPEGCLPNTVINKKITFETGELLIADWIKLDEFLKVVDEDDENKWSDERNLNYTIGRVNTTSRYADLFNFICVSVGNSSPHVFSNNGDLTIGCLINKEYDKNAEIDEDNYDEYLPISSEYKEVAQVCTDFWGVTIIDKQQLIDILSTKYENANELVENYIKNSSNRFSVVQVPPGEYTLKFHGNYPQFDNLIEKDEFVSFPKNIEKFFMVIKEEKPTKVFKM